MPYCSLLLTITPKSQKNPDVFLQETSLSTQWYPTLGAIIKIGRYFGGWFILHNQGFYNFKALLQATLVALKSC